MASLTMTMAASPHPSTAAKYPPALAANSISPPSPFSPSSMTVKCLRLDSPSSASVATAGNQERLRCKRLIHLSYTLQQTQASAVARRNARERRRVRLVNLGFATLREHVPRGSKNKKLSKVETLRSAIEYIKQLEDLLADQGTDYGVLADVDQRSPATLSAAATPSSDVLSASSSPASSLGSEAASPYNLPSQTDDSILELGLWFS